MFSDFSKKSAVQPLSTTQKAWVMVFSLLAAPNRIILAVVRIKEGGCRRENISDFLFVCKQKTFGCNNRLRSQTIFKKNSHKINCQRKHSAWNFYWGSWVPACVLESAVRRINQPTHDTLWSQARLENDAQNLSKYRMVVPNGIHITYCMLEN